MKYKSFAIISLLGILLVLGGFIGLTVYVDPLFHYHAPTKGMEYPLFSERYMNDGITRNFEYDAIITGTSMTQNFSTTLFDELFGTHSIKIPVSGARYKEVNEQLERAFKYNDHITKVLRCLDLTVLVADKDSEEYADVPDYLYDENIWNDVHYVLNKDIFYDYTLYVFEFMKLGGKTLPFDAYSRWEGNYPYDATALRKNYVRRDDNPEKSSGLTAEEKSMLQENLQQNVLNLVVKHPETDFYLYFPPYSLLYWDDIVREGRFAPMMEAQKIAIEMLLPYDNIHLYGFFDDYAMIVNLGKYIDNIHYGLDYSNEIMRRMEKGQNLLTYDNYEQYLNMLMIYNVFDYDSFFAAE